MQIPNIFKIQILNIYSQIKILKRETAIRTGKLLNEICEKDGKRRSFVFISGSRHPPFLPRYLTTKFEAENFLLCN